MLRHIWLREREKWSNLVPSEILPARLHDRLASSKREPIRAWQEDHPRSLGELAIDIRDRHEIVPVGTHVFECIPLVDQELHFRSERGCPHLHIDLTFPLR